MKKKNLGQLVFVVHRDDNIFGVLSNKKDAEALRKEESEGLAMYGYIDDRVYITERFVK